MRTLIISSRANQNAFKSEEAVIEVKSWLNRLDYDIASYHLIILDTVNCYGHLIEVLRRINELTKYPRVIFVLMTAEAIKDNLNMLGNNYLLNLDDRKRIEFALSRRQASSVIMSKDASALIKNYHQNVSAYEFLLTNIATKENKQYIYGTVRDSQLDFISFAKTDIDDMNLSGIISLNRGNLIILPDIADATLLIKQLELLSHFGKTLLEGKGKRSQLYLSPMLSEELKLLDEADLIAQQNKLHEKLKQIEINLQDYSQLKEVLVLDGNDLRDRIMDLFEKIGIKTFEQDVGEEDFWLVDGRGQKMVICEAKGKTKNIERSDINKLDDHRTNNKLSDTFPALLVVNTFKEAQNLKEKDIEIDANTRKHAINVNTLVTRTLDLLRIMNLIHSDTNKLDELREHLTEYGWLTTADGKILVKK